MFRFQRIHAEGDSAPPDAGVLAGGGLDMLHLEFVRPRLAVAPSKGAPELPEIAAGAADAIRGQCKTLFLEPGFHIVASAGWNNTFACVELVARALIEGGLPDLPVSAVRGSHVLPILDYLQADGVRLDNLETGASWKSLRAPILAADLQLGAGPVATALAEGGRVVVAGYCDGAAPAIARAVREFGWSWHAVDRLAAAAAAARAAIWPHRHDSDWLAAAGVLPASPRHPCVELGDDGAFTVDLSSPLEPDDAARLVAWLQAGRPNDPAHLHADVRFDAAHAAAVAVGPTQLRVTGCTGARTDGYWRLEVLYQSGFVAEALIEFSGRAPATLRRQIADAFQSHFVDEQQERSLVTAHELGVADNAASPVHWLHLACRSPKRRPCAEFVDHVTRFAAANPATVRLPGGGPVVHVECGLWPARVPRDAVDVAVDTRPAREWE